MRKYYRTIYSLIFIVIVISLIAHFTWSSFKKEDLQGVVFGNGRLEATEIDISTKFQGRIADVLYNEGDLVKKGDVMARIDTESLEAQLREAEAKINQSKKELLYSQAILQQRFSERDYNKKKYYRYIDLYKKGIISLEQLDLAESQSETSIALVEAARAQISNSEAAIASALAASEKIRADINDCVLKSPRDGRVQYRLAEPGEVLPAGGKILTIIDLSDIYMTVFLPESQAGKISIGAEARIVLDAFPNRYFKGSVSYVSPEAQFTPKQVETTTERQKLVFRTKVQLTDDDLSILKPGMPGVAYIRLTASVDWPDNLK